MSGPAACSDFFSVEDTPAWHGLSASDAAIRLHSDVRTGLSADQVRLCAQRWGPNQLSGKPPRSPWSVFFAQFKSLLTMVLIAAAALAASIGHVRDAVVILTVILLNAALGFYQEYRAEQSLAALRNMLPAMARVRRDGKAGTVAAEQLVPGDIVLLEAGDRVPADGRLVASFSVEVDESALTGESVPAGKHIDALAEDVPLAERINMGYMNTMVTHGRAELLVTATGMRTEMGRISSELANTEEGLSPLQMQLDRFGKRLAMIAGLLVTLLFSLQLLRGEALTTVILDAIALAVAALPEGLPAVVTVTLAIGMRKLARQHAIVKRLAGVETLGCTTVICSDKTGTLTLNQMTARALFYRGQRYIITGEGYHTDGEVRHASGDMAAIPDLAPLLWPATACNDSQLKDGKVMGDPTEGALLALAAKGGIEIEHVQRAMPRIAELPFDSAHKYMATFHREGEHVRIFLKGAPDVLLAHCSRFAGPQNETALDSSLTAEIGAEYHTLAGQGLRGLMIATRTVPAADFNPACDLFVYVNELTFLELIGLMDPPRPEVKEAIALCRQAGIEVKMITGDHTDTAAAVAKELGLTGRVVTGVELNAMQAHELAEIVEDIVVFARVVPEHKVKTVRALKEKGHVVAMTGDGVNDAPALKAADIGVAMGITGTEVAKEAAAMVLTDDFRHHRRRGKAGPNSLRKYHQFRPLPTLYHHRCSNDPAGGPAGRSAGALQCHPGAVGGHDHGRPAGSCAGARSAKTRRHAREPAPAWR